MDWRSISLDTFIPELPLYWNNNFTAFKNYLDVFYDETRGILIKPLETTGRVRGAKGEFVTVEVDNLIVRNQWTNLYDNFTTADAEFVTAFTGDDASTRAATEFLDVEDSSALDASVYNWPYEPSTFRWIDTNQPYYKIGEDASYGFQNDNLGQEFRIIFPTDTSYGTFNVLLASTVDPSVGDASVGITQLQIYGDTSIGYLKLITTSYDASMGPTWTIKEFGAITFDIQNYTL